MSRDALRDHNEMLKRKLAEQEEAKRRAEAEAPSVKEILDRIEPKYKARFFVLVAVFLALAWWAATWDPSAAERPPSSVQLVELAPLPKERTPVLRGTVKNGSTRDIKKVVFLVHFEDMRGPQVAKAIAGGIPSKGSKSVDVPLGDTSAPPTTWQVTPESIEWEDD